MRYTKLLLLFGTVILFFVTSAQSLKQGIIVGTIRDARTKSPLTEAVVTVSSNAFQGQKFALTDSTGTYKVNNLPAGNYKLSFEMEGYEKFLQDSITLKDGMTVSINYDMLKEKKRNSKNQAQTTSFR